jgi:hypothetical protein
MPRRAPAEAALQAIVHPASQWRERLQSSERRTGVNGCKTFKYGGYITP